MVLQSVASANKCAFSSLGQWESSVTFSAQFVCRLESLHYCEDSCSETGIAPDRKRRVAALRRAVPPGKPSMPDGEPQNRRRL